MLKKKDYTNSEQKIDYQVLDKNINKKNSQSIIKLMQIISMGIGILGTIGLYLNNKDSIITKLQFLSLNKDKKINIDQLTRTNKLLHLISNKLELNLTLPDLDTFKGSDNDIQTLLDTYIKSCQIILQSSWLKFEQLHNINKFKEECEKLKKELK